MGYQRDEFDDTWADLVPEQPSQRDRLPLYLAAAAVALVALCLCVAAGYVVYQEFLIEPTPVAGPLVPTGIGTEAAPPVDAETSQAAPTVETGASPDGNTPPPTPPIQATVTLAQTPTTAPPTIAPPTTAPQTPSTSSAVEAIRLSVPPAVDGTLNDWPDGPSFLSSFLVFQQAAWNGTDDLTAVWRLGWDDNNLYVGAIVDDDVHVQTQSGNQIFRGDSLDIQFDTNREADFGPFLSPDDFQITLSPGDFVGLLPSAWRFQGTSNGRILDAPGGHRVSLAAQKTGSGYTIEAAIPWSDLSLAPASGLVIGMALNANDNDTPGTAVQEVMKSHVISRTLTDPTGWGTLILR